MFKNLFSDFVSDHDIDTFLDELSYWQSVNLYTVLAQISESCSFQEARKEAIAYCTDSSKLHHLLEEAINSPAPKRDISKEIVESELEAKDKVIRQLLKRIDSLEKLNKNPV